MEFTRLDVVKYLHSRGITPVEVGYRAAVEKYILFRFDLLIEELVSLKKFRNYCSLLTSKVKQYYEANSNTFERMLDDASHKVVFEVPQPYLLSWLLKCIAYQKSETRFITCMLHLPIQKRAVCSPLMEMCAHD